VQSRKYKTLDTDRRFHSSWGKSRRNSTICLVHKKLCLIAVSAITASIAVHPASAQVAEAAIAAVAVEAIKSMVSDVNENDNQLRENFARYYIDDAQKKYPDYNVVLIHTQHTLSGEYTHDHVEVPISLGRTIGYEIYFAGRGRPFTLTRL
jgi:hypothetical protein